VAKSAAQISTLLSAALNCAVIWVTFLQSALWQLLYSTPQQITACLYESPTHRNIFQKFLHTSQSQAYVNDWVTTDIMQIYHDLRQLKFGVFSAHCRLGVLRIFSPHVFTEFSAEITHFDIIIIGNSSHTYPRWDNAKWRQQLVYIAPWDIRPLHAPLISTPKARH